MIGTACGMGRAGRRMAGWIGAMVVMLWLAGCTASPGLPAPTTRPETTLTPTTAPTDPPPAGNTALPTDPALALLVNVARVDLARRLKVTEAAVTLASTQETEMPVGSLGCSGAEGWENQGIVMGTEIVLVANGAEYIYRSDHARLVPCFPDDFPGGHAPIFVTGAGLPRRTRTVGGGASGGGAVGGGAKSTLPPPEAAAVGIARGRPAVASALADLAERLKIPVAQIGVSRIEEVDWPDASLGCAQRGRMYAQVITPGYRIILEAGGKTYEYHASETRAVMCGR